MHRNLRSSFKSIAGLALATVALSLTAAPAQASVPANDKQLQAAALADPNTPTSQLPDGCAKTNSFGICVHQKCNFRDANNVCTHSTNFLFSGEDKSNFMVLGGTLGFFFLLFVGCVIYDKIERKYKRKRAAERRKATRLAKKHANTPKCL